MPLTLTVRAFLYLPILLALLVGCGDKDKLTPQPENTQGVARVELTSTAVLLTSSGDTRQLAATAYNASGTVVPATVTWESSNPAVTVDATGKVTATSGVGSAQITAKVGTIASPNAFVTVAPVTPGTVLLNDTQIVTEQTPLDPNAEATVGVQSRAVLTGVPLPAVGTLLLSTGQKAVAGRVVSAVQSGANVTVVVEARPLMEQFQAMNVSYSGALGVAFTGAPVTTSRTYAVPAIHAQAGTTFKRGPLTCKASGDVALNATTLTVTSKLTADPTFEKIIQFGLLGTSRRLRMKVTGGVEVTVDGGLKLEKSYDGKVSCVFYAYTIPLGGVLGALAGPFADIGADVIFEPKLTATGVDFSAQLKGTGSGTVGFDYTEGQPVQNLSTFTTDTQITPRVSTPLDAQAQASLKASLGVRMSLSLGIKGFIDKDIVHVRGGPRFEMDARTPTAQAVDATYKSSYALKLAAVAEPGDDAVDALKTYFTDDTAETIKNSLTLEVSAEVPLLDSPKASAAMDKDKFIAGETVKFTVQFEPAGLTFFGKPLLDAVEIYRLKGGQGVPVTELIAAAPAVDAQQKYTMTWTADTAAGPGDKFFAFARVKYLSAIPLELTTVKLESGDTKCTLTIDDLLTAEQAMLDNCALVGEISQVYRFVPPPYGPFYWNVTIKDIVMDLRRTASSRVDLILRSFNVVEFDTYYPNIALQDCSIGPKVVNYDSPRYQSSGHLGIDFGKLSLKIQATLVPNESCGFNVDVRTEDGSGYPEGVTVNKTLTPDAKNLSYTSNYSETQPNYPGFIDTMVETGEFKLISKP